MTVPANRRAAFRFQLDLRTGVPAYRQIMDQVAGGVARGALAAGDQLPTVRQLAVDLAINPNTVIRAYRELELRGLLETQQGTGTFITAQKAAPDHPNRRQRLAQLAGECAARAGVEGFSVGELVAELQSWQKETDKKRR